jgi:hypothetical protein
MRKIPANPVMDIGAMTAAAQTLGSALQRLLERLPFPLVDAFECWATDHRNSPVALLATTEEPGLIPDIRPAPWQATRLADHGFVSPSLLARGIPAKGQCGPRQHAEQIERQVSRLGQQKTWFRRLADGSGEPVGPSKKRALLDAAAFPPLGLKADWKDPQERQLAEDYLAWQAPRLLTLQGIDDEERRWLEPRACRQAVELAAVYRLVPRILDRAAMEAARVEARLRDAAR